MQRFFLPLKALAFLFLSSTCALSQIKPSSGDVIFDMDTIRHQPGEMTTPDKKKVPVGTVELVDGKFGKAVRFSFTGGAAGFMAAASKATPAWDHAAGFSFWVKGDGKPGWGGIELLDRSDFSLRYGYCFPIDSPEWKKITVPWSDLTPELKGPLIDPASTDPSTGYQPSRFGNFWFGRWFYWREYPALTYDIDQVALEPTIEVAPIPAPPDGAPLARLQAKLHDHKPITIVTMGDSLTDKHHWSNKSDTWAELLAKDIKSNYGSDVKLINPAIGGTTLSQNLVLMPRWSKEAPAPDLVTIWFGGNDWETGVRGPRFKDYLRLAVDRIRRQTNGSADILLMTTCPSYARYQTMSELEQAARDVATEKKVALVDVAADFRKAGTADEALKAGLWARDKTHLGAKGHEVAKEAVLKVIER